MNSFSPISSVASAPAPARHFDYLAMRVPGPWATFGLTLALATAGLLAEALGKQTAVLAYLGVTGVTALLFPHFTLSANKRNALLWAFPVWAVFSAGWSIDPGRTWHASLLLCASLVGMCAAGAMPHRREAMTAIFLPLFGFLLYSLAFGHVIGLGIGDTAFSGVLAGKNQFGHLSAMEIITSCAMLAWAGTRHGRLLVALGFAGFLTGLAALLASRATGALISTGLAMGAFTAVMAFRRLALPFRVAILVALVGAAAAYIGFGRELEQQVFSYVLQRFGKDTTLTGRTELWDIGDRMIALHPVLGRGYGAFWYYTNPEAMMIWRMAGVQPNPGFTFHNTFRDLLIEVGAVGLACFVVGVLFHFLRNFVAGLRSGDAMSALRVATVFYFLIRMPVEPGSYNALTATGLVFIGSLCFAVTGERARKRVPVAAAAPRWRTAAPPIRRASAVRLRAG